MGLGLATSKAIAESHHGTLKVTSDGLGHGATFTLLLPLDKCRDSSESTYKTAAPGASMTLARIAGAEVINRPLRILLVEDHADTAAILIRLLRRMGHDVIHANTITGALQTAHAEVRSAGIDLVMSDLRGIALSGFGMESDLEQSRDAGFSKHLIKPVDIALLKSTITELTQGSTGTV